MRTILDSQIFLVVEGIGDIKLLKDLVSFSFNKNLEDANFLNTKGYCDNWIDKHRPLIEIAKKNGMLPAIVLDANGNFQQRQAEIVNELAKLNLTAIPYFLLPNNADNGNLETLLFRMMLPKHSAINVCYDQYRNCLPTGYTKPPDKDKVYAYAAAILPSNKIKLAQDGKREYTDTSIWDLNNPYLQNLKNFLQQHL